MPFINKTKKQAYKDNDDEPAWPDFYLIVYLPDNYKKCQHEVNHKMEKIIQPYRVVFFWFNFGLRKVGYGGYDYNEQRPAHGKIAVIAPYQNGMKNFHCKN